MGVMVPSMDVVVVRVDLKSPFSSVYTYVYILKLYDNGKDIVVPNDVLGH